MKISLLIARMESGRGSFHARSQNELHGYDLQSPWMPNQIHLQILPKVLEI